VSVTDTCDTTPTVVHVGDLTNSTKTLVSRTYRATDDCSNAATCVQAITIAPVVTPICGDVDHDGDVDAADYAVFRAVLRKCAGQPGFNPEADYDGDGCITLGDYQRWYACYKAFLNRP